MLGVGWGVLHAVCRRSRVIGGLSPEGLIMVVNIQILERSDDGPEE